MSDEATLAVIEGMEVLGIPYMVVGSLSSNCYGVARSTQDADFVAELGSADVTRLVTHLGPGFEFDAQMSFETVTGTSKFVLHVVDGRFTVELFQLSSDPHDQERFRRRRRGTVAGRAAFIPSAEDVPRHEDPVVEARAAAEGRGRPAQRHRGPAGRDRLGVRLPLV